MLALVAQPDRPARLAELPEPKSSHCLLVRVALVGICNTDVSAARGELSLAANRVLGHEAVGLVEQAPPHSAFSPGQRVAVIPWLHCGHCATCRLRPELCPHAEFLGIDRDGAFSEYVLVPERAALPIPTRLDWATAALLEPVAAARAVLAPLTRITGRLGVLASGRFRRLLELALEDGPEQLEVESWAPGRCYDAIIDGEGTSVSLERGVESVRPGGSIIVKSRPLAPVAYPLRRAVQKEVSLLGTNYAPFAECMAWLTEHRARLAPLLGKTYPLCDYQTAFSEGDPRHKSFLRPSEASCAD